MAIPGLFLQLYSLRHEIALDAEGTIRRVAGLGFDGLELAGIEAEVCPDIAVLVTSGTHSGRPRDLGPRVRYVPKPWHPTEVLRTMRDAVLAAA